MKFESDFNGVRGTLPPDGEWRTVHRGIVRRPFEIEVALPDGTRTKNWSPFVDSRWAFEGERWLLQLRNKGSAGIPLFVRWYIPAAERVCCHDYGRGD